VLLARSTFADGHVYIPDLFIRRWSDAAPGLLARVLAWTAAAALLAFLYDRSARGLGGASPARASLGLAGLLLILGLGLESWPRERTAPAFAGEVPLDSEATAFVSGRVGEREDAIVAETGDVEILVRSSEPRTKVAILVGGAGSFQVDGLAPVRARPAGAWVLVPLDLVTSLRDRTGRGESLSRGRVSVDGEVVLRFGEKMENSER
jgi:hypothetical protein